MNNKHISSSTPKSIIRASYRDMFSFFLSCLSFVLCSSSPLHPDPTECHLCVVVDNDSTTSYDSLSSFCVSLLPPIVVFCSSVAGACSASSCSSSLSLSVLGRYLVHIHVVESSIAAVAAAAASNDNDSSRVSPAHLVSHRPSHLCVSVCLCY